MSRVQYMRGGLGNFHVTSGETEGGPIFTEARYSGDYLDPILTDGALCHRYRVGFGGVVDASHRGR